jgi:glycerophosphoryl diester phosphodiesterase
MSNPLLDPNARLVIAHRGNRAYAAENTIEALEQAVALGADALEFDIRMTRDGIPVLMHDAGVDRTTDASGLVASFTYAELQSFDAGARSPHSKGHELRVPSLEEVLDLYREIPLVIEVKEPGAVDATHRLIRQFGAEHRVVIGSADRVVMQRFYQSDLRTCASMRDATRLIAIALVGLTPASPKYHVLSVTPRFRGVPIPILRMAAAARKAGVATQVWTINDPAMARALWDGGVSGIVTDDPAAIIRARTR